MIHRNYRRLVMLFAALIFSGVLPSPASAEIIDDIILKTDENGEVDAIVKFTVPIQYLRHYPQGKSPSTSIFFNILGSVPADEWKNYESHRAPPSDLVQDIMVSTWDRGTGPKVQIKFKHPVTFAVSAGKNNQVLLIHIKPGIAPQKNGSKPEPAAAGAIVPPVALAIPRTPSVPTPSITEPAAPVIAEKQAVAQAAAPVPAPSIAEPALPAVTAKPADVISVPKPAAPVVPSGDVTPPKVVLAPSRLKPIRIPLGGKDGLPVFPDIDQVEPQSNAPPPEKLSLAEQISRANDQAAVLMEKGGRALLAGQSFLAIESFNKVLNLPPNKYTQDAQLWVGIARERSGQLPKAILEFNTYLKLYPDGKSAEWVKTRLGRLKAAQPALFQEIAKPAAAPVKVQNTEFHFSEFGSISMYYYWGKSQVDTTTTTTTTAGTVQSPQTITRTDQNSLTTNLNMTARGYNNEYDNRLVFQGFYAANFQPNQKNTNRLGAAYYEMKDRIVNYSFKIGRQSSYGGGVMGRFDGISAGYGFAQNWRANVVVGELSDYSIDDKPKFRGVSLDFGTRSPLGGSVYYINQTVSGFTDRKAVGGNLRYFEQRFNIMSMLDYDVQFKALNMITVQGTLNGGGSGTDYNFLLDRRRSPILDIRNAVNGTGVSIATLIENGFTTDDMILLANQRTTVSNMAQVGMTNHLDEKWSIGTDFTISNTAGLSASGDKFVDAFGNTIYGTAGYVEAQPSSGNTWTISERATGLGVFLAGDITNFSLSYTKGASSKAQALQVSNHVDLKEKWTLDTVLSMSIQNSSTTDLSTGASTSSKTYDISPSLRAAYRVRNNLSVDGQLGLDWNKNTNSYSESPTTTWRNFISFGGRFDF
ncbi:MAG: hypothetical protein WAW02_10740 [Sideroxyarcus sp.]